MNTELCRTAVRQTSCLSGAVADQPIGARCLCDSCRLSRVVTQFSGPLSVSTCVCPGGALPAGCDHGVRSRRLPGRDAGPAAAVPGHLRAGVPRGRAEHLGRAARPGAAQ